jgi:osmoprotectant transport system ATP-binding protein
MIRLQNLRKSYDGGKTFAVDGVDLDAPAGEVVALIGESGCGKTTTLKMINRLIEPSSGSIHVNDEDVTRLNPVQLRRRIGYVFQGVGLFPHYTIADNIAAVPRLLGWSAPDIDARVDEMMELVGLEPATYRRRKPEALSGGQQQRVGVARALAARPDLMLLDEPFGALDPVTRVELQEEFRRIQQNAGVTAVMVTHDMSEALLMGDRIAVMQQGRIIQYGTPHELLSHPDNDLVKRLVAMPRQRAERIESLLEEPAEDAGA